MIELIQSNENIEKKDVKDISLEGLPKSIQNALKRWGIITFESLIACDYDSLSRIHNIGEMGLKCIRDYVREMGYKIPNEHLSIKEIKETFRLQNATLLEDIGIPPLLYGTLNQNGIYTVEDLVSYGPEVFSLFGMGVAKRELLAKEMREKSLSFKTSKPHKFTIISKKEDDSLESLCEKVKDDNTAIEARIEEKRALIEEYEALLLSRKELLKTEAALDQEIESLQQQISDTPKGFHG